MNLYKFNFAIVYLIFSLLSLQNVRGQAGMLDSTFSADGIALMTASGTTWENTFSIRIQPDGKLLILGRMSFTPNVYSLFLIRYNLNGSLDSTFSNDGIAILSENNYKITGLDFVILPNGKIICSASRESLSSQNQTCLLVGFTKDGNLDLSFGFSGEIELYNNLPIKNLSLTTDSKVIGISGNKFIRFDYSGNLDPSYDFYSGGLNTDLVIQPDGKIVVCGYDGVSPSDISTPDFLIARFNADGTADATFNGNGRTLIPVSNLRDFANSVVLQPDGKILVGGIAAEEDYGSGDTKFAVLRLMPDGKLDPSFGDQGISIIDLDGQRELLNAIALQPDGKILLAGEVSNYNPTYHYATIKRLTASGILDTTFSNSGVTIVENTGLKRFSLIAIQPDGKVIVTGKYQNNVELVARFLTGLTSPTHTSSVEPGLIYPNPFNDWITIKYNLAQSDKITVNLYDESGRLAQTLMPLTVRTQGEQTEVLQITKGLLNGNYVLVVEGEHVRKAVKIIK